MEPSLERVKRESRNLAVSPCLPAQTSFTCQTDLDHNLASPFSWFPPARIPSSYDEETPGPSSQLQLTEFIPKEPFSNDLFSSGFHSGLLPTGVGNGYLSDDIIPVHEKSLTTQLDDGCFLFEENNHWWEGIVGASCDWHGDELVNFQWPESQDFERNGTTGGQLTPTSHDQNATRSQGFGGAHRSSSDEIILQSVLVGNTAILAELLMIRPSSKAFDYQSEASKFNWLLQGTTEEIDEIYGSGGLSRKLLHTISQITLLAARLQEYPESVTVPTTAKYLHRIIDEMKQWSTCGGGLDQHQQLIDGVKSKETRTYREITHATAEAWRITSLIYLYCRVFRFPRNHGPVINLLTTLAKLIDMIPTSGPHFTAQSPFLPVLFLGLLATNREHRVISMSWFEDIAQTSMQGRLPLFYENLKDICKRIDNNVSVPSQPCILPDQIGKRDAWWDRFVTIIYEERDESVFNLLREVGGSASF